MYYLKKFFAQSPWHYGGGTVVAVAAGLFRYFTLSDQTPDRLACYEVFSLSGMVTFLFGMLLMVAYLGAFDLFGYVFSPGRLGENRKYRSYADYAQQKEEKRARGGLYFVPYLTVGLLLLLISVFFA